MMTNQIVPTRFDTPAIFVWPEKGISGVNESWIELTPAGVFYEEWGRTFFVCSPLRVVSDLQDLDTGEWGRTLIWTDPDGVIHEWFMPMRMLATGGLGLRRHLLSGGVRIGTDRKSRRMLNYYVQHIEPSQDPLPSV